MIAQLYRRMNLEVFPQRTYLFESRTGQHFRKEYISRETARERGVYMGDQFGGCKLRHSKETDLLASTKRIKNHR